MANTINIAVIAPYKFYPAKTGGEKSIANFYQYFSPLLPVTVIGTANNKFPPAIPFTFLPLLGTSKLRYINPRLFFIIKKIIREKGSTHLIIEHPYYGWLGLLLKWFCKIKLVVHSHNIEATRFKSTGRWWWRILALYEKIIHRNADINFFITAEDREFAIQKFKLNPGKSHVITYGFELYQPPTPAELTEAKQLLRGIHGIAATDKVLFFNGTLDYKPNLDAVNIILDELNPRLLKKNGFGYKLIICGKGLPDRYQELKEYASKNIIYAGFVEDISLYFKGADCFINPVIDGGGIKTKLVEALGFNLPCISTENGAIGVSRKITGNKLRIVPNDDWEIFTNAIFDKDPNENIPSLFFDHFYWGNIAGKAAGVIDLHYNESKK